jgi:hypothetical protein
MRIRPKKKTLELFEDSLVNQLLQRLAALGTEPVAEGATGEERDVRHKFVVAVVRDLTTCFGEMPAVKRAMAYAHDDRPKHERFGIFASGIALLFGLNPDDFVRHVQGRANGLDLDVRKFGPRDTL